MRFLYRYQDKERGVLEGEIAASSESDAYTALRKSGVRPMKVWPAPGVFNRLSAIGKRGLAILLLALLCLALAATARHYRAESAALAVADDVARPLPRRQVSDLGFTFTYRSENALLGFARPGDQSRIPSIDEFAADLPAALKDSIRISPKDADRVVLLKRVMAGVKDEVRVALASGEPLASVYGRLVERQRMESAYRESMVERVRNRRLTREEANETLRLSGLAEISENEN